MTTESGHRPEEHDRHTDRFCPRCGTALESAGGPGDRPRCPACGHVLFADPKVAAAIILERGGRVLLTRRNHEPGLGRWSFPSGYIDRGELVEAAAERETFEEVGLHVAVERLVGVYSAPGDPVILVVYAAAAPDGAEPVAGDEAFEVGWFAPDALPPLAFERDVEIIADWRRADAGPGA